jgi:hypothetical protein
MIGRKSYAGSPFLRNRRLVDLGPKRAHRFGQQGSWTMNRNSRFVLLGCSALAGSIAIAVPPKVEKRGGLLGKLKDAAEAAGAIPH